ncbi:MAG: hypothetical protein MI975_00830 [Cytophagales bacterium]|nr:hypothetical protein [Cytophagales bacterium]
MSALGEIDLWVKELLLPPGRFHDIFGLIPETHSGACFEAIFKIDFI